MIHLPNALQELVDQFESLPGIGGKTARRLAFYLLNVPSTRLNRFARALSELKTNVKRCSNCFNLTEDEMCAICADTTRDTTTICVVEEVLDLIGIEQTRKYNGVYHVLYGRIDPLNNMGPDDIFIPQLLARIQNSNEKINEIIIATNPNMEGEATAQYLRKILNELKEQKSQTYAIRRLAYGLPMGASIEYADYGTLGKALENRDDF